MEQSKRIVTERGITLNDVSEVFYFSFDGGRHAMYFETDENDPWGTVRYHCVGFDENGRAVIYWI